LTFIPLPCNLLGNATAVLIEFSGKTTGGCLLFAVSFEADKSQYERRIVMDNAFHQQALQNYAELGQQIEALKTEHDTLKKYLENLGLIEKKIAVKRTKKATAAQNTAT
jgi:hypothetical protein